MNEIDKITEYGVKNSPFNSYTFWLSAGNPKKYLLYLNRDAYDGMTDKEVKSYLKDIINDKVVNDFIEFLRKRYEKVENKTGEQTPKKDK